MARGGTRPGAGAPKGVRKATLEKQAIAQQVLDRARMTGKKLGKEVIEEMMEIAKGATASYQPITAVQAEAARAAGVPNVVERVGDMEKFGAWWDRTVYAAKELAKYQSPQFRAVLVAPAPEAPKGDDRKRFTLTIFEGGRAKTAEADVEVTPAPAAKTA